MKKIRKRSNDGLIKKEDLLCDILIRLKVDLNNQNPAHEPEFCYSRTRFF